MLTRDNNFHRGIHFKAAGVMNPGCSYLLDILYAGPLSPSTELSTFLRKHAPAAPKCTESLKNHLRIQTVRLSWRQMVLFPSTTSKISQSSNNDCLLQRSVVIATALLVVINLFLRICDFENIHKLRLRFFWIGALRWCHWSRRIIFCYLLFLVGVYG